MRKWWLVFLTALIIVVAVGGMMLRARNDTWVLAYLGAMVSVTDRYGQAFQVDYAVQDPRLADGIREMEVARTELAAITGPRRVQKLRDLALDAMDMGIEGHLLLRAGGDPATIDRLLDLSVSLSSEMSAEATRIQDHQSARGQQ